MVAQVETHLEQQTQAKTEAILFLIILQPMVAVVAVLWLEEVRKLVETEVAEVELLEQVLMGEQEAKEAMAEMARPLALVEEVVAVQARIMELCQIQMEMVAMAETENPAQYQALRLFMEVAVEVA